MLVTTVYRSYDVVVVKIMAHSSVWTRGNDSRRRVPRSQRVLIAARAAALATHIDL